MAIVALPLSMAIAIASGASPAQGLYAAIVGGFIVSALGGSRFQIGGPAGAFIVLVAATAQAHGLDGLLLATMMSGVILAAIGFLKLGTYIKFIPYPVTVGFTAGIAVIILASQIKDLLGLELAEPEPGELLAKLPVLYRALPTLDGTTIALSLATIAVIVGLQALAAAVARHADRRRGRCRRDGRRGARRRDDRLAVRRDSERLAAAVAARRRLGQGCCEVLPAPFRSRCSARSSRCCRPSSPTA